MSPQSKNSDQNDLKVIDEILLQKLSNKNLSLDIHASKLVELLQTIIRFIDKFNLKNNNVLDMDLGQTSHPQ